jgi:hypothetical protein
LPDFVITAAVTFRFFAVTVDFGKKLNN